MTFIDLENTVIEDWDSFIPMPENIKMLKEIFKITEEEEIGIFSFAIFNDHDKKTFEKQVKPLLEAELNVKSTSVVTKEELIKILSKEFHLTVTEDDFLTFLNKEIS